VGTGAPVVCEVVPTCPICGGKTEFVYDRPHLKVCLCVDCHTGINVPAEAWEISVALALLGVIYVLTLVLTW